MSPSLIGPANTASARSRFPTTSLLRFLISTVAIFTALISRQPDSHLRDRAPLLARTEGCFPDRSVRRAGSAPSRAGYPNVPPCAFPSERARDTRKNRSIQVHDGTWNRELHGRRGNDAASRSPQSHDPCWFQ